uniref:FAD-binding PCMH-type domain-containing protein n=1 Tax=Oryza brachyantha TaxID=4533 RepID=J3MEW1_ORYBR
MAVSRGFTFVLAVCCYAAAVALLASADASSDFLKCLAAAEELGLPSQLVVARGASPSLFTSVLASSVRNPRFLAPGTVRPVCVVTPTNASHVQAAVLCGRRHGRSVRPEVFALVDLASLRAVRVNRRAATAWVDSGATVGELSYAVAKADPGLAFAAGLCPTIGVGGHFSGGGIGMMMRKYGLSVDNVLDAVVIDANGRLLDKKAMGRDHFWAIRGGGGESFGIVLSWKVRLLPVPRTVTVFNIWKTTQGAVDAVTKWQTLAPALPDELTIRVVVQSKQALFQSVYLGTCDQLLPVMSSRFPELGMTRADCREMSWLQSTMYINSGGASSTPVEELLNRTTSLDAFTKNKSDYVKKAISKASWEKIFPWFDVTGAGLIILEPHGGRGGRVNTIADGDTPYPHRSGVLYNIQYIAFWPTTAPAAVPHWIKNVHGFMEPFVSSKPRAAYVNYRDLDIGENAVAAGGATSYESGRVWGEKYFGAANFRRLALTKGKVDAGDYFRNEQSIPPLVTTN